MMRRTKWRAALLLGVALGEGACSRGPDQSSAEPAPPDSAAATPVRTSPVVRSDVPVVVSGPGRLEALDIQQLRAPFTGVVRLLHVAVGDRVGRGEVVGTLVAQASEAALQGARNMRRLASTEAERRDAERALALAAGNLIETALHAPRAGVVVSRAVTEGELVNAGDSIASIATTASVAFIASISQNDLALIRPGQAAALELPGWPKRIAAVVHGVLAADTTGMSVPVRLDVRAGSSSLPLRLFGTAHVTVGMHRDVTTIPASAVLRDDVRGYSRVAVVGPSGRAHWIPVTIGAREGDTVEVASARLRPGDRVLLGGQVGLPEDAPVRELPGTPQGRAPQPEPPQGTP